MVTGRELAEAIATQLSGIANCRVYAFNPDTFQPPGIVVGQPSLSWNTPDRTFGQIQWTFTIVVAVARPNDKTPHDELDRLLLAIADVLGEDPSIGGIASYSQLIDASPAPVVTGGVDLPGYIATLEVIA